ncbi:DUF2254 domain-containing protein [Jannaschia sp. Os4]|uniref:DUF2254 domain-containing protein n=1 Tax=Jannaschia sp. Os4 TaxID=2807617 RepID=UPI00193A5A98|nr:DUF2254 domain-containing protein [Jannaschia sp. Os4]MBM2574896.1 DUF2254 domain-containing protein [Jannaschia sp. Os4]
MTIRRLLSTAWIRQAVQEVRASYWFLPACAMVAALVLAWAINWADGALVEAEADLPQVMTGLDADGARTLISTIASAVIGVTGVMFSLTIVAVTHAAGKYGPRLIGNFLRDRGNQTVLAILIGVFTFAVVNLWLMGGPEDRVPHLVVAATFVSIFPAIAAVIYFIHHVPETINVSNIAAGLGGTLIRMVREEIDGQQDEAEPRDAPDRDPDATLRPDGGGYVQAVDFEGLEGWAEARDAVLRVEAMPGSFVAPRGSWLSVWGAEPDETVERAIALGAQPTETQTITFVADQLVEMCALALSPGVNDPFTAITCLDWLAAGLMEALEHGEGLRARTRGRVIRADLDFAALYARAFPAAAPYVKDDAMAAAHAERLVADLARRAERGGWPPRIVRTLRADARRFRDAA